MNTKYEMWLTYNAEAEKIQIPVLPESLSIKNGSKNDSIDITGLGEIVIFQERPAMQFSFSSFFPAKPFSGMSVSHLTAPSTLISAINEWKDGKEPVHFIAAAGNAFVNIYCSIEDFSYSEEARDPGAYQYSLSLKEYREINVRRAVVNNSTGEAFVMGEPGRVDNSVRPKTYEVKYGDSLYSIAKRLYGHGESYMEIYKANKTKIGGNINYIVPGMVLTIP